MARGTHDNDNEPNPWTSIGLQAALIVNKLRLQAQLTHANENQNEQSDREQNPSNAPKDRVPDNAADIERRIADILAMENRLRRKRI